MTNQELFTWIRSVQSDKKLKQSEVDVINELLTVKSADELKKWLMDIMDIPESMSLSEDGYKIIGEYEAFRAAPYKDSGGVWTIGYGNTYYLNGQPVRQKDKPLTEPEARALKAAVINRDFAPAVNLALAPAIKNGWVNQNMFDACVSLCYNIGVKNFSQSSVVRYLNQGNKLAAANSFELFNKDNGVVVKGLVNRRLKEKNLFLK